LLYVLYRLLTNNLFFDDKADVKRKKLLDFDVHIEGEGDSEPKFAIKHIKKLRKASNKVIKFDSDGKFDTNEMLDALGDAESTIKIRKNAKLRLLGANAEKER